MNTNTLFSSTQSMDANKGEAILKSYWLLRTELLQISKFPGYPINTCDQGVMPLNDVKNISNSENFTSRKPMQVRNQSEEPVGAVKPGKKLLERNRLKVTKLKIPSRAPVSFHPVIQDKPGISKVLDFLYLGNARDAKNHELLKKLEITHVVNATSDQPNYFEGAGDIKYLRIAVEDSGRADLTPYFMPTIDFIDTAVRLNGRVLVHCQEGISRSTTLVAAYIMSHSKLNLMHTLGVLSYIRPIICPNINFLGQLEKFYESLQVNPTSFGQTDSLLDRSIEVMIKNRFIEYQMDGSKEDAAPNPTLEKHRRESVRVFN